MLLFLTVLRNCHNTTTATTMTIQRKTFFAVVFKIEPPGEASGLSTTHSRLSPGGGQPASLPVMLFWKDAIWSDTPGLIAFEACPGGHSDFPFEVISSCEF